MTSNKIRINWQLTGRAANFCLQGRCANSGKRLNAVTSYKEYASPSPKVSQNVLIKIPSTTPSQYRSSMAPFCGPIGALSRTEGFSWTDNAGWSCPCALCRRRHWYVWTWRCQYIDPTPADIIVIISTDSQHYVDRPARHDIARLFVMAPLINDFRCIDLQCTTAGALVVCFSINSADFEI